MLMQLVFAVQMVVFVWLLDHICGSPFDKDL